jgi:O-antigen/teichoic acid export membrane protein
MFFKLIGGVIIAKFLGPALYGVRNAFQLAIDYEAYSELGTFFAMSREVPYSRGEKNEQRADQIVTSTFGVNLIYALLVGFILVLVSFYLRTKHIDETYIDFVFFLGLIIITNKLKKFFYYKLIVDKKVFLLSRAEMIYGIMSTILCVILVYYLSFRGVLIGLFVADLIYLGYILINEKRFPVIRISLPLIWNLLKIGFPMMIVVFLLTLLRSADRLIIIAMLTEEDLGYFGIATVAIGIIITIPLAVNDVISPRLMEKLGKTKDIQGIKNYLIEPTILMAYFLPFLLATLYLSIHLPINYFLIQYSPSIDIVKILTLGLFFGAVYVMPVSICYAVNKQIKIIYIILPAVLFNFVINYLFIKVGWGVNGVALGSGITNFIFTSAITWFAFKQFQAKIREIIKFFLIVYFPFLYTLFLVFTIDNIELNVHNFFGDIVFTIIKLGLFSILYCLIFILIRKHSAITKLTNNVPFIQTISVKVKRHFSTT